MADPTSEWLKKLVAIYQESARDNRSVHSPDLRKRCYCLWCVTVPNKQSTLGARVV